MSSADTHNLRRYVAHLTEAIPDALAFHASGDRARSRGWTLRFGTETQGKNNRKWGLRKRYETVMKDEGFCPMRLDEDGREHRRVEGWSATRSVSEEKRSDQAQPAVNVPEPELAIRRSPPLSSPPNHPQQLPDKQDLYNDFFGMSWAG